MLKGFPRVKPQCPLIQFKSIIFPLTRHKERYFFPSSLRELSAYFRLIFPLVFSLDQPEKNQPQLFQPSLTDHSCCLLISAIHIFHGIQYPKLYTDTPVEVSLGPHTPFSLSLFSITCKYNTHIPSSSN